MCQSQQGAPVFLRGQGRRVYSDIGELEWNGDLLCHYVGAGTTNEYLWEFAETKSNFKRSSAGPHCEITDCITKVPTIR